MYNGLELWNLVDKTDMSYTKKVSYGQREFTSINPYYQIKNATKLWGPFGGKWGIKNISYDFIKINGKNGEETFCMAKFTFYYPNGEFQMINSIAVRDDEYAKKLFTDSLTKCLSYLGFNGDIFLGEMDKHARYTETAATENNDKDSKTKDVLSNLESALKNLGLKLDKDKKAVIGKTYGKSQQLKALGFKWSPENKAWMLEDEIPF